MQVCMYTSMQVCEYTSMHVCKYASIQVYKCASIQVCKYTNLQVCMNGSTIFSKYPNQSQLEKGNLTPVHNFFRNVSYLLP